MNYRLAVFVVLMIVSLRGLTQTKMSFGITTGYDQNYCLFQDLPDETINQLPDFNIGADIAWYLGERIRVRGEVKYVNISFARNFSNPVADNNIDFSKLAVNNINFNPRFDYRLFSLKKLDLYMTTGLRFEFSMGDYIRTFNYAGENLDTDYLGIGEKHASTMAGATGGFILKYNFTPDFALTLSPEYTSFFSEFYQMNNMSLQRASLNIGFEWSF